MHSRSISLWERRNYGTGALSEEEFFLTSGHGVTHLDVTILVTPVQHETAPGAVHATLAKLEKQGGLTGIGLVFLDEALGEQRVAHAILAV